MIGTHRRRRRIGVAGLAIGLLATAIPLLSASPASADTPTTHTVRATTTNQPTPVAPNGPLTGLVQAQTVSITVTEAGPTDQITGIVAIRQCEGGVNIANSADLIPSNTGNCLSSPLGAGAHNVRGPFTKAVPSDNFITGTFNVGIGTQTVNYDDGSPQTNQITCDSANSCSLWIQIARSGGNDFIHYNLAFLGAPGAPTGVIASCTATGANVSWTAPVNTGNSAISSYSITATPTAGGAPAGPFTSATTSTTINGLEVFEPYDIAVTATNAGGQTGPASSPAVSVTPCVTQAPALAAPIVGAGQAELSWTYGGPAGQTGFEVAVAQITPAGPTQTITVNGASASTTTVTGLVDGTLYGATVRAIYGGGNFSALSNAQDFTPVSTLITQTITVRRPQGALVLTQVCTEDVLGGTAAHAPTINGGPATDPLYADYPYPQDALTGDSLANYPTNCGIALAPGKLMTADDPAIPGNEAGNFFQSSGKINQVTVVDTRDVSPNGWTVNGKMANFTQSLPGAVIVGDQLGWDPVVTDDSDAVTFSDGSSYDQTVAEGAIVNPNQSLGTGLGSSSGKVLGSAPVNARLGIAKLDANIRLWIPVTARTGNYTGVLTITAI